MLGLNPAVWLRPELQTLLSDPTDFAHPITAPKVPSL